MRLLHLGLGNFFRSHQAWYTDRCPDAREWGYAAFAGRSSALAETLEAQDGLYTLVTRAAAGDRYEIVGSLARAHGAEDHQAWLSYWRSETLAVVTSTITEAGYLRAASGGIDPVSPAVRADVAALRSGRPGRVITGPGRLVAGLAARRRADAGAVTLVCCDNLPSNGTVMSAVVTGMAALIDPALASWVESSVSFATTVVDRITPGVSADEAQRVAAATGWDDRCPVVAEPFAEWVISGDFVAGRPDWEGAGVRFTENPEPYERRKLWLLNGAHSLMAYAGSIRGHATVPEAVADPTCRGWIEEWWSEAGRHVGMAEPDLAAYQAELLTRFSNSRMADRLSRIAEDGSQKIPVRVMPVLREERASGRVPPGAVRILAAWICHLRGSGAPVRDARAAEMVAMVQGPLPEAARRVVEWLDPLAGSDGEVVNAVAAEARSLAPGA